MALRYDDQMTWVGDMYRESLAYFERMNQRYRDYILNIQRVNEVYSKSIKIIERMNELYKEFIKSNEKMNQINKQHLALLATKKFKMFLINYHLNMKIKLIIGCRVFLRQWNVPYYLN